ncbi:hypothetical protein Tco_1546365 [Tanacetum coccineum]
MPRTLGTHDDEAESSRSKRSRQNEIVEEAMLLRVHHPFLLWEGCNKAAKIRSQEEIFSSEAWRRVFDINELIYTKLCHVFYSTYEFDEVCVDDELRTKKVIKFQLCGRAHSLTLLEFARRLGFYHSNEVNEEGFDVYFQGGLRGDENFNAMDYWLSISTAEELHLSRSLASTIRSPILQVLQKMITYGLCQRMTVYDKLITKTARKMRLLTNKVLNSLSSPTYCRALDTTTLRELIDFEGRLIAEVPAPGVPCVAIPRGPIPSMHEMIMSSVVLTRVGLSDRVFGSRF